MILRYDNYRAYLKAEFDDRISANATYSLRIFAQKIGVSVSFLSEVLNGKKTLSAEAALKIALRLELNESDSRYFCLLAQLEAEKDPADREAIEKKLHELYPTRKTVDLSADAFRAISDWYHFAILELTYLQGFKLSPKSAAAKLDISPIQAEAAIDRLLRLELLEISADGQLQKATDYVLSQSHVSHGALKTFHKQLLEKSIQALQDQDPDERISSTDIVPIDPRHFGEVKRLSDQFTEELLKISKKSKVKTDVYCLSVHFFNVTPTLKRK